MKETKINCLDNFSFSLENFLKKTTRCRKSSTNNINNNNNINDNNNNNNNININDNINNNNNNNFSSQTFRQFLRTSFFCLNCEMKLKQHFHFLLRSIHFYDEQLEKFYSQVNDRSFMTKEIKA